MAKPNIASLTCMHGQTQKKDQEKRRHDDDYEIEIILNFKIEKEQLERN